MTREPLSLYLHIPFCSLKCAYCDFNSYAGREELVRPYDDALIEEIRLWSGVVGRDGGPDLQGRGPGRPVPTVFFGGGTPSLLPLSEIERVMAALREKFPLEPDAEVSLEANPGTVDREYLRGLLGCGINRISFGVQSFHDDELAALDRIHSADEAKQCYRWARAAGFERINLDLMYGLPEQPIERWQATLERAISLQPDHLSLYALTVEEGTKLAYDIDHGRAPAPDPDAQAAMYEWSCERLDRASYGQYEISNWARPGQECRHNLVYWRDGEWLGLGAGAHSHWGGYRFADVYSPKQYVKRVSETTTALASPNQGESPDGPSGLTYATGESGADAKMTDARAVLSGMRQVTYIEEQPRELQMADAAILALRLNEGLDVAAWEGRFRAGFEETFGPRLAELRGAGLLERENGRLFLTPRGRLLANEVFVRLLPD